MSVNVLRRAAAPAVIGLLALAPGAFAAAGDAAHGAGAENFPAASRGRSSSMPRRPAPARPGG